MFSTIYGFDVFQGNEERAIEVYNEHIRNVRAFFSDKQGRYHEQDFTKQRDWQPLCEFLGEPIPSRPFPHANNRPKSLWAKAYHQAFKRLSPDAYRRWVRDKG